MIFSSWHLYIFSTEHNWLYHIHIFIFYLQNLNDLFLLTSLYFSLQNLNDLLFFISLYFSLLNIIDCMYPIHIFIFSLQNLNDLFLFISLYFSLQNDFSFCSTLLLLHLSLAFISPPFSVSSVYLYLSLS